MMIIKEVAQIDLLAKQIFSYTPYLIPIDIRDYNRIKSYSTTLNAVRLILPFTIKDNINIFIDTIHRFNIEGANHILLQISEVNRGLETPNITLDEINAILGIIEKHFGNVNITWGLCNNSNNKTTDCEINVIVGYKL